MFLTVIMSDPCVIKTEFRLDVSVRTDYINKFPLCVSKWMHNNLFLNFYCLPAHILNKLSEFQMVNDPKYQMFKFLCQHTAIYTPFNGTLWLEFWRQNYAVQLIKLIKSAVCSTVWHIQWRNIANSIHTTQTRHWMNMEECVAERLFIHVLKLHLVLHFWISLKSTSTYVWILFEAILVI